MDGQLPRLPGSRATCGLLIPRQLARPCTAHRDSYGGASADSYSGRWPSTTMGGNVATGFERPARREAALIGGASVVGALALSTHPDDGDGPGAMLPVAQIICYTLILGAAVLHYFDWRVSSVERDGEIDVRLTGWLTVGLVLGASHGLVVAVTGDAEWQLAGARWPRVTLLVVLLVLCLLALVAERVDVPSDPALLGGAAASLLVAGSSLVLMVAPPSTSGPVSLGFVYAGVILAATALSLDPSAPSHRRTCGYAEQLAVAVALLTAGGLASALDEPSFVGRHRRHRGPAGRGAGGVLHDPAAAAWLHPRAPGAGRPAPALAGRGARGRRQGARAAARGRRHPGGHHQRVTGDAPRPGSTCVASRAARVHAGRGAGPVGAADARTGRPGRQRSRTARSTSTRWSSRWSSATTREAVTSAGSRAASAPSVIPTSSPRW